MAETKTTITEEVKNEIPRAVTQNSILTIEVDASIESTQEKEEAKWHQLLNAQRTRKILTGPLSGIEKLESGWTVAVTYFNGYRILIPMSEMMINLKGDGRENADTLNRQVRIANNMLGADIDFIIKDLDEASRSVVASRKDAMLRKRQIFYFTENEEEQPMVYPDCGSQSDCGSAKSGPAGSIWCRMFCTCKRYGLGVDARCNGEISGRRSGTCLCE